ncbi:ComEC/Rec2 family competence protein [Pseudooceanicola nitratireducens]|uniref:ComEC/Rec2 family competence protein n=1 Tax=Pseudooceanicola nitratireducens TaxID=517719 RepID=UPI0031072F48
MPRGLLHLVNRAASGAAMIVLNQRGALFPWVPVLLALGIANYFVCATEPRGGQVALACAGTVAAGVLALRSGALAGPMLWAVALLLAGFCLGALRAQVVAAPVLGWRYYGPVQGRIVMIDRSGSDAVRLTLDRVLLPDVDPARTPDRVRLSLHGEQGAMTPLPGLTIQATAHLSPPGGAVEPGGFDFQRHTWFDGLGAIGYTRVPVMAHAPPERGTTLVFAARMALSDRIRAVLPGDTGAFAAAITAGDRSALSQEVTETLRRTNLAHLLAISGLHMGLVTGFVFAALRLGGAIWPQAALNWPVRSIAAGAAIAAGAVYLALSGAAIATERAFVMACVAFLALIAGRRAISLRALALAALVVLILRPEALLSPGFQMSFAATTALVAAFGALRGRGGGWPLWTRPVVALLVSSSVAGFATAPVGAAHFNTFAHYGLVANLVAVPVMGLFVMPAAVLAVLLMPLGAEAVPLTLMGLGLDWILLVARSVAAWEGAVGRVIAPGPLVLPLYALGGLWVILWQGHLRWLGMVPLVLAAWLWSGATRPQVLIEEGGQLVGVMTPSGRALSRGRGAGFPAEVWLENDGSALDQQGAFALWPSDLPIRHLTGKRAAAALSCSEGEIVVLNHDPPGMPPCTVFSPMTLRDTGALALTLAPQGLEITSARAMAGRRLWNDKDIRASHIWRWPVQGADQ